MKHMQKLLLGLMASLMLSLASCALDYEWTQEDAENQYMVAWIKRYGLIDPEHTWNMATQVVLDIDPASFGEGYTVCVYTRNPAYGGALIARCTERGQYPVDVVRGTESLFLRAYAPNGGYYSQKAPISASGTAVIAATASRADSELTFDDAPASRAASRAGDSNLGATSGTYQFIIACEDLGNTGDVDFNDIVLGLNIITENSTKKLNVTALAAGGIYQADVYYSPNGTTSGVMTHLGEIHQALGAQPHNGGTYPMINTTSFNTSIVKDFDTNPALDNDFSITHNMGNIVIKVKKINDDETTNVFIRAPKKTSDGIVTAPLMLLLGGDWQWPQETVSITKTYPTFVNWNKDTNDIAWASSPAANQYVPRDIPLAPGEDESTIDPVTGKIKVTRQINVQKSVNVNGVTRYYALYVPEWVSPSAPLVVSLHGAQGSVQYDKETYVDNGETKSFSNEPFDRQTADTQGCVVVYPQGLTQNFNMGNYTGWNAAATAITNSNDDEAFIRAVVADAKTQVHNLNNAVSINDSKIYCCGFSNGGMMTYHLSTVATDIFAAFASISGFPMNEYHLSPYGLQPVPFLHIHGKDDDFVKYSLVGTIRDVMVARNGCNPMPTVTTYTNSTKSVYAAGNGGFPYVLYEVTGMGHWSGCWINGQGEGASSDIMWNFLNQYTLGQSCDPTLKWRMNVDAYTAANPASAHGWTVTSNNLLFRYGTAKADNNADYNVYRTINLKGKSDGQAYKMTLSSTGTTGHYIYVKLTSLSNGNNSFSKKCEVGKDVVIPFGLWSGGDYTLTIQKEDANDRLTSMEIHSCEYGATAANCVDATDFPELTSSLPDYKTNSAYDELPQYYEVEDSWPACTKTETSEYTQYEKTGGNCIAFKMKSVNVTNYDRLIIYFYEPLVDPWHAVIGSGSPSDLSAGIQEYFYDIPSGTSELSEIMLFNYGIPNDTKYTAKVYGVFLHKRN